MAGLQPAGDKAALPTSILKKVSRYGAAPPPAVSREEHNRELALHHATLIQQRKDVQDSIFAALEQMLDFPSSATTDPLQPSLEDTRQVQELMNTFQPSDFDSLVEERNIDGKCGYVLCPRPHRVENTRSTFRLLSERGGGVDSFRIVKKDDLEKWCSDTCGKHALYLRVQLSQTPAWERAGRIRSELEIYGQKQQAMGDGELDRLTDGLHELALERGDKSSNTFRANSMQVEVREREPGPVFYQEPAVSGAHRIVDGYATKTRPDHGGARAGRQLLTNDNEDDIMDTI